MPNRSPASGNNTGNTEDGETSGGGLASFPSAVILPFCDENKTGTNEHEECETQSRRRPLAAELGIERVCREVVDFGDPKSSGIGDSWGYKSVSVPRISLLDGDVSVDAGNPPAD